MTTLRNPPATKVTIGDNSYTILQLKKAYESLSKENEKLKSMLYCHICGSYSDESNFYKSYDPNYQSGHVPICKSCISKIINRVDSNGDEHGVTKGSLITALKYLNKPFYEDLYKQCVAEEKMDNVKGRNFAEIYIVRILAAKHFDRFFSDSDMFKERNLYMDEIEEKGTPKEKEYFSQYLKDKEDTIKMMGYDPFGNENPADQPFLYSQLLTMLDAEGDTAENMVKIQSAIAIIRCFLQVSKIDDSLTSLMSDPTSLENKAGEIQKLQDAKTKMQTSITKMADSSCLSEKSDKRASKGDNTWTGKLKMIKDRNLRCAEVNGYDLNTCRGMEQVMDLSHKSILKVLHLDDSEYSDLLAEQREMLVKANNEAETYKELFRILLRENIDLKELLTEHEIDINIDSVDLKTLIDSVDEDGKA